MGNTCGDCLCFDWHNYKKGILGDLHYCKKYAVWRRVNQGACGGFVEKGGCYLTSACVEHKGLEDNCEQLTLLRQFRDRYLKNIEGGQALIDEYYDVAPALVSKINSSSNKASIYEYIFEQISICVELIKKNEPEAVLKVYTEMTQNIQGLFC